MGFLNNNAGNNDSSQKQNGQRIETSELIINGNLFRFGDETINISNIASMNTSDLPVPAGPGKTILVLVLIALGGLAAQHIVGVIVAVGCVALAVYLWRSSKEEAEAAKQAGYLNITLNAGVQYSIFFFKKEYIKNFRAKFDEIFYSGGKNQVQAVFDMRSGNFITDSSVSGSNLVGKANVR